MNRRILGNILIILSLILVGSGIIMFFTPFKKNIASLHTFFALLFIVAILFHVINNKRLLTNYLSGKKYTKPKRFYSLIIFSIAIAIATGLYFNVPVLNKLYALGNQIRNSQLGKTEETFDYQVIHLDKTKGNKNISIELKKGNAFQYPLFAVWVEDSVGNYVETLYISRVISSSTFDYGKKVGDKWKPAIIRRPEALPYWSHKRGIKATDGLYVPLNGAPDLDAVSGATPTSNFIVKSKTNVDNSNNYRVLIEVNQSYDWNEFYTNDRFPDDETYSGSGQVGQPSLIYAASIDQADFDQTTHKIMQLVGHGHHSGQNGKLYEDLTNITTAKSIAERIILTVE